MFTHFLPRVHSVCLLQVGLGALVPPTNQPMELQSEGGLCLCRREAAEVKPVIQGRMIQAVRETSGPGPPVTSSITSFFVRHRSVRWDEGQLDNKK